METAKSLAFLSINNPERVSLGELFCYVALLHFLKHQWGNSYLSNELVLECFWTIVMLPTAVESAAPLK